MDGFLFSEFLKLALPTAAGLLPIVMALVTYWGKLGVSGKWQTVSSMATGLVLGGFVMYIQVLPQNLIEWSAVGLFGLILGLAASGVYEIGKELMTKDIVYKSKI